MMIVRGDSVRGGGWLGCILVDLCALLRSKLVYCTTKDRLRHAEHN